MTLAEIRRQCTVVSEDTPGPVEKRLAEEEIQGTAGDPGWHGHEGSPDAFGDKEIEEADAHGY